jgi:hypothetical protein
MTGSKPLSKSGKCPEGYIRRKGYTRKNTGTRVKTACIRSTSAHKTKPNNTRNRQTKRLQAVLGTKKQCPPGQIARKAYVRRITSKVHREGYEKRTPSGRTIKVYPKAKSIFVPAACVEDTGKAGKLPEGAPIIGPLRQGELKQFGYSYKFPEPTRRQALVKAVKTFGPLSTYRKLDAIAKLTQVAVPQASQVFASDRNWIRRTYGQAGVVKAF